MKPPVHPLAAILIFASLAAGPFRIGLADTLGYEQLPDAIDEASGLTPSRRDPTLFWTHDDNVNLPHSPKGGTPWLFAIDAEGRLKARLLIDGVKRRDWEAITDLDWQGQPTLMIGDIGDNRDSWPDYRLWLVPEPRLTPSKTPADLNALPIGLLRFRYPDGSHDAESLAIDTAGRQILILTKRQRPAKLYALPLSAIQAIQPHPSHKPHQKRSDRSVIRRAESDAKRHLVTARPIATLAKLNPTDPIAWLLSPLIGHRAYRPTDMALSRNGRLLVVLTYAAIYFFERRPGESWANAVKRPVDSLSLPFIDQWEGVSFSHDQRSLIVVREGSGPRTLLRLPLDPSLLKP